MNFYILTLQKEKRYEKRLYVIFAYILASYSKVIKKTSKAVKRLPYLFFVKRRIFISEEA